MRYGLHAAIIAGVFCLATGEAARTTDGRSGDYFPGAHEMTLPAGLYFEDDIYFHDGRTGGSVKLHPDVALS